MTQRFFQTFNQSPYSFYFLVVDEFLDISLPELKNFHLIYAYKNNNLAELKNPYFCLEEQGIHLTVKNSGKLLSHPKVIDYIQKTSKNLTSVIIPFKPSSKIEHFCHQQNWINAAVSSKLNRFLEDKNQFFKFCQKNNLSTIPTNIDNFTQSNFLKYQKKYGSKLVLQSHFGWAGNNTFSADSWDKIKDSFPQNTLVKFSPFIKGYSLINNCCLSPTGLVQSPPALQLTGIKTLTDNPFATAGRQWPSMAPLKIIQKVQQITSNFSQKITKLNYLGFFGLDFLIDQNEQVYLLECNPRLTASFSFYTQIEIQKNLFPLFLFHLSQFIKVNPIPKTHEIQKQLNSTAIIGTEITKKIKTKTVARHQEFNSITPTTNPIKIPKKIIDQLHV
jgi:predicted ATP-grasp superfamily ATP-dependent carboligase